MLPTIKTSVKSPLIAFLLLSFLSITGCRQPEIPEYQALENFSLGKIGMKETVVSADLKYYNPNNYELQFRRADLEIAINDRPVGNTVLDTLIRIPKKDTFYVPVQMKVNMKQLLGNALTLLMNDELDIKVNGTIRMGRSGFFMNIPVNYQGKQKIEW
ncbi:MAG: LEA type 2 family protein [Flavihumibacter sp.]|jgi:LEA14-like dessication related protein|nr:LEA type 2 family protein [Flavihumibacter sp.]